MAKDYKQYTETARRGIKGEAFFELLMVSNAIPHRIAGPNDVGIDFLCELVYGDRPRGILFSAQVKSTTIPTVQCSLEGKSGLNQLEQYTLHDAVKPDDATINYWKGLNLPAYLFYVVETAEGKMNCYYKRYTPMLDGHASDDDKVGTRQFYLVNEDSKFRAFADPEKETGGFVRDLVVDYARCAYSKGHVVNLTAGQLGFWPFEDKPQPDDPRVFRDPLKWNRGKIETTCKSSLDLLSRIPAE